ncbi:DUF805 domain-containing protein [Hoeflea sp.]|uniref:DUF805 domain-containing protein n=1 Tax=Hoeflea sp. TaxID=1940281 RepID=UPI003BAEA8E6
MDFQTAVRICLKEKYATIAGRARRSEYWWFFLFVFLCNLVLGIVDAILFGEAQVLQALFSLAILVPAVCVGGRRMHDTGRSAWWLLLVLIPLVGSLILLFMFAQKGTDGPNEYGPDPLAGDQGTAARSG